MSSSAASAAIPMQQRSDDGIGRPSLAQSARQGALGTTPGGITIVSNTKITYTRAELLALSTSPISTSRAAHLSTVGLPTEISRSPVERKEMDRLASLTGREGEGGKCGDVMSPATGHVGDCGRAGEASMEASTSTGKNTSAEEQFAIDL